MFFFSSGELREHKDFSRINAISKKVLLIGSIEISGFGI